MRSTIRRTPEAAKRVIRRNRLARWLLWPLIRLYKYWNRRQSEALSSAYDSIFSPVEGGSLIVRVRIDRVGHMLYFPSSPGGH